MEKSDVPVLLRISHAEKEKEQKKEEEDEYTIQTGIDYNMKTVLRVFIQE